jgi:hypothetical protein
VPRYAVVQSVVTSSGQNDTGLFETNLHDERYLPFEEAGAISTWKFELPNSYQQFDYDTMSDLFLAIRYTSLHSEKRSQSVVSKLKESLNKLKTATNKETGLWTLFSLKNDFPTEFHRLVRSVQGAEQAITFELKQDHFPYFLARERLRLKKATIFLQPKTGKTIEDVQMSVTPPTETNPTNIKKEDWTAFGNDIKQASIAAADSDALIGFWKIASGNKSLDPDNLDNLSVLLNYSIVCDAKVAEKHAWE